MPGPPLRDDRTILDQAELWRRVLPSWIVPDQNVGGLRVSSAFRRSVSFLADCRTLLDSASGFIFPHVLFPAGCEECTLSASAIRSQCHG